ncbi:MAG: inositol monophosphatase family protein [Planctomycetota bacterium]
MFNSTTSNGSDNINKIVKTVKKIVISAGEILQRMRFRSFRVSYKGEKDLVTEADYFAEEFIVKNLKKEFPDSAFLTEENYKEKLTKNEEFLWIIDPLDGTTNYYKKFMFYSISVALYTNDVVSGIIFAPAFNDLYWTHKYDFSYKNTQRIYVSDEKKIENSFLVTGFSYAVTKRIKKPFETFKKVSLATLGVRRCGSAALDLAYVSCGIFDGFWEEGLNPWDIAAGFLLVKNAGGKITNLSGQKLNIFDCKYIVATNGKIHTRLLKLLAD